MLEVWLNLRSPGNLQASLHSSVCKVQYSELAEISYSPEKKASVSLTFTINCLVSYIYCFYLYKLLSSQCACQDANSTITYLKKKNPPKANPHSLHFLYFAFIRCLLYYSYDLTTSLTALTPARAKTQPPFGPERNTRKGTTHLHQFSRELICEKFLFLFIVYCKCFFFFLQSLNLLKQRVTDEFFLLLCPCLL